MKILFVDDDLPILRALHRALRKEGHELVFAESGAQALELVRTDRVDVIITDNVMPGMSGASLLQRVRAESPDTLRILMSAVTDAEEKRHGQLDGSVDWFIEKPWDLQALKDLLRAISGVRSRATAPETPPAVLPRTQTQRLKPQKD